MFIYHQNEVRSRTEVAICRDHVRAFSRHHRNLCLLRVLLKSHGGFSDRQEIMREMDECERLMSRQERMCHGAEVDDLRRIMIQQTSEFRAHM